MVLTTYSLLVVLGHVAICYSVFVTLSSRVVRKALGKLYSHTIKTHCQHLCCRLHVIGPNKQSLIGKFTGSMWHWLLTFLSGCGESVTHSKGYIFPPNLKFLRGSSLESGARTGAFRQTSLSQYPNGYCRFQIVINLPHTVNAWYTQFQYAQQHK